MCLKGIEVQQPQNITYYSVSNVDEELMKRILGCILFYVLLICLGLYGYKPQHEVKSNM